MAKAKLSKHAQALIRYKRALLLLVAYFCLWLGSVIAITYDVAVHQPCETITYINEACGRASYNPLDWLLFFAFIVTCFMLVKSFSSCHAILRDLRK